MRKVEVGVMPNGWTGIVVSGPGGYIPETEGDLSLLYAAPNAPVWVEVELKFGKVQRYCVSRGHVSWARFLDD